MKGLLLILLVTVLLAGVVYGAGRFSRGNYESAPYRVVRTDGNYEVRDYPALTVAQTKMRGEDDSFMRLFRYIDGQNAATQKIAMTTPVFMTDGEMAFVLPEKVVSGPVPSPKSDQIAISVIPAGRFAVWRFDGGRSGASESNAVATLSAWLARENLTPVGSPMFGYFDPPWTPPFLRRNEVMLRLAP